MRGWFVFIIVWLISSSALAQTPSDDVIQAAREAFRAGTTLTRNAQWADALAAYERSASLHAHATTTYNIAFCERALGRYTRARTTFSRALEENVRAGGGELAAELIAKSKGYITELDGKMGRLQITLSPPDAAIAFGGRPLEMFGDDGTMIAGTRSPGAPEPVPSARFDVLVDPGEHTILLVYGTKEETRRVQVKAGEVVPIDLQHSAALREPTTPPGAYGAYVAWGLGGAALIAGIVAGAIATDRRNDLGERCPNRNDCPADAESDISLMQTASDISTAGFVVGGVTAALGVVLYFTADTGDAEVAVSPTHLDLRIRF